MKKKKESTAKIGRKQVTILGLGIDRTTLPQVLTSVDQKVSHNEKIVIMTPNPELILASTKNYRLKKALESADFLIPDGVGLKLADGSLKIIKGRDLFLSLIELANKNKWRVFLLGGLTNEAELTAQKLINRNLELKTDFHPGPRLNENGDLELEVDRKIEIDVISKINDFKPHLLFVAFGNPKQEIWLSRNAKKLNARVLMTVGGVFRYYSGKSKLPPEWLDRLGLEWLWRLITEPFRFKRIVNATVIFPLMILSSKFKKSA